MTFTIEQLNNEIITGKQYKFAIPKTAEDFVEVNTQKQEIFADEPNNIRALIINDPDESNGTYKYFIEHSEGNRTVELSGGAYAVFTGHWKTLADLDHFIGACYGELAQSAEYKINGTNNLQLIDFEQGEIILKLPASQH
ncbi:effector binding domain-containing protein [Candidatus Enterococcus lemimoniae]|uniref:Integron-associated effector binding protein domain-containing protein n=1 Tax=Candidatus Enterococcus lemimoniae TaxID=1834167 RepID=A0ABZ2T592_9ENTE|nr:effector binding domain-containing protein [Enterococcus sp. 12C11_DIV0727]OTO68207.1 hypothetical protein A5866_000402 [Enterococcus sp. 12C11_DIV0727]